MARYKRRFNCIQRIFMLDKRFDGETFVQTRKLNNHIGVFSLMAGNTVFILMACKLIVHSDHVSKR